MYFAENNV